MAVNNQCNDGYGSFIKNLTLEKFLWCMKLDLGGYICIWLLLSEFITQFLMVLDSTVDKLSTDPVCSQQKLPNIELFNVTTDSLIKLIMDNDKCMQAMMETKMELLFIRAAVLLLMIFFGIKSTEGIEKGNAKFMKVFKIITLIWMCSKIGMMICNFIYGSELAAQTSSLLNVLLSLYMFVIFNSLQFQFKKVRMLDK